MDNKLEKEEQIQSKDIAHNPTLVERYLNKSRKICSKSFQRLDALPSNTKELQYFIDILKRVYISNETIQYEENETYVTLFCTMFPLEIIYAAKARPISLCSTTPLDIINPNSFVTNSMCPLMQSIENLSINGLNKMIDNSSIFIMPLSCDCKCNIAIELDKFKKTYTLQIPFDRLDDNGMELYIHEMKQIGNEISKITGVEITRESLAKQIRLFTDTQKEIEIFNKLKAEEKMLIRGSHALIVLNSLCFDDISNWKKHLKKLNEELIQNKNNDIYLTKKKLPRILLLGSPISFPNIKIPLMIEEQGGRIVYSETCLGDKFFENYTSVSNDNINSYFKSLAYKSILPNFCSAFPNNDVTINKLNKLILDYNIDGIIYVSYSKCLTSATKYQIVNKVLKEKNIPSLYIETVLSDNDNETLNIRIGAFIEMLNANKR